MFFFFELWLDMQIIIGLQTCFLPSLSTRGLWRQSTGNLLVLFAFRARRALGLPVNNYLVRPQLEGQNVFPQILAKLHPRCNPS